MKIPPNSDDIPTVELDTVQTGDTGYTNQSAGAQLHRIVGRECLQGLSLAAEMALLEKFSPTIFAAGETLLEQGKVSSGLYLIQSGSVRISVVQDGQQRHIDKSSVGEVLGEISLLTNRPCTAHVVAIEPTEAYQLSREDFEELKQEYPELEIALSQIVSDRLGRSEYDALCGKQMGEYSLTRCINRGGMGVVYEATHIKTGKRVALKMLRHKFVHDILAIREFLSEGELLTRLSHENLVSVSDCFVALNTRFLVMDLWSGQDLNRVVRQHGALEEATVRGILGQIAAGLDYAHENGVLHLDIKPSNILISADGRAALSDFGLSRLLGSDEQDTRTRGTPVYMPPEQFREPNLSRAADWYALACTAVEMLSGNRVFSEASIPKLMVQKNQAKPSEEWPQFDSSDDMRQTILKALERDQNKRMLDLHRLKGWAKRMPGLC